MTHTKPPHKPFTKKFWILLSSSILSLLLVYGGIVWAVEYFREAPECSGTLATNCTVVGKKGSVSWETKKAADKQETAVLRPKESAKSNADDTSSNLWKKRLVITNADPTRNYFIPLRTEREIVSAYKATLPNGVKGNQKDGGLFRKVNICAKGGAVYTKNKISPYFVVNLPFVNRLRSSRIFITYILSQNNRPRRWSNKCCMPKKLCVRLNVSNIRHPTGSIYIWYIFNYKYMTLFGSIS